MAGVEVGVKVEVKTKMLLDVVLVEKQKPVIH